MKKIKVLITGSVYDGKKFLEGVNELPLDQALSLVENGYAQLPAPIEPEKPLPPADPPAGDNNTPNGDEGDKTPDSENKPDSDGTVTATVDGTNVPEQNQADADKEKSEAKSAEPKSGKKK